MHPKYTWSKKDVGSPKSTSLLSTFHIGLIFVSFQPILCHPHAQIRIIFFHDVQRDIPSWKLSPNRISIGFSQIAFPIIVLPKEDDHTDFVQEETTGSSILDHDFGHLCRGRRIQMSGHSDLGISPLFWEHLPIFYLGTSRYCVRCLSIATRQSGDESMILAAVI